jgi:hypothetical protein
MPVNDGSNVQNTWFGGFSEQYEYDGTTYFYKDSEGRKVRWNTDKQEWEVGEQVRCR